MTRPQQATIAFTLAELSRRLDIPIDALRIAIRTGSLACGQVRGGRMPAFNPMISKVAAQEFCINHGINAGRLA